MKEMLKVESMEFTADIAGAVAETRSIPIIVVEGIKSITRNISEAMK